jgi:hypothetical protein
MESFFRCQSEFVEAFPNVKFTVSLECCEMGCYIFDADSDKNLTACPHCQTPRNKRFLRMVDMREKVKQLVAGDETRKMINEYSEDINRPSDPSCEKVYGDFHTGSVYQEMVASEDVFTADYNLKFMLMIDGFSKSKSNNTPFVIVHCVVLSFDPKYR